MIKHLSPKTKREIFHQFLSLPFKQKMTFVYEMLESIYDLYDDRTDFFKAIIISGILILCVATGKWMVAIVLGLPLLIMLIKLLYIMCQLINEIVFDRLTLLGKIMVILIPVSILLFIFV